MSWDAANATLEVLWTVVLCLSIRRIALDKVVKGISPWHIALTAFTACWFVLYYAHLQQWWSVLSAAVYCVAVSTWVATILWYARRKEPRDVEEEP